MPGTSLRGSPRRRRRSAWSWRPGPPRTGPNAGAGVDRDDVGAGALIWLSIDARAPLPIATMTITAATPMIRPSAVSAVRIALRRSALTAIQSVIHIDMAILRSCGPSAISGVLVGCALERFAARRRRGAACVTGWSPRTRPSRNATMRVRVLGDVRLVRDEHDREPPLALSRWKMPITSMLVRVSRLPVGSSASSSARIVDQRAGDRHALLLAAGELVRVVVEPRRRARRRRAPRARARAAPARATRRRRAAAAPRSRAPSCAAAG